MPWSELEIQPRALAILRRAVESGKVAHAYLFSGPTGAGKDLAARLFAQALNCDEKTSDPCGLCHSCDLIARSMEPGKVVHPDIIHLAPGEWVGSDGKKQASDTILVDAVRDLRSRLYNAPLQARNRVVLIHETDKMQIAAQNAFLKTLEEPLEKLRTVFVLTTNKPLQLLPTIRSRCQKLYFGTTNEKLLVRRMVERHGVAPEKALFLARLSEGSTGSADRIAMEAEDNDGWVATRGRWLDHWHNFIAKPESAVDFVDAVGQSRDALSECIETLLLWHRDLLICALGQGDRLLINLDRKKQIENELKQVSMTKVISRSERLLEMRDGLDVYIRADLAIDSFLAV